jgi:tetratricopeptide (TPR) repeat protein
MLSNSNQQRLPNRRQRRGSARSALDRVLSIYIGWLCVLVLLPSCLKAQSDIGIRTPTAAMRLYAQGVALAQRGDADDAIRTLQAALIDDPGSARILDAIGAAYSVKGDFGNAKTYFEHSLNVDPIFVSARQNLGIACFTLGDLDGAAAQFNLLRSSSGQAGAAAALFLGMIAERKGAYTEAQALLEESGKLVYRYPEATLSLANAALKLGNHPRALEALNAFDNLHVVDHWQRSKAADLYTQMGVADRARLELTVTNVKALTELDPAYREALLLYKQHRLTEAQDVLGRIAASRPSADVLLLLAHVAKDREDFAVAMKSLKQAAQLDPGREESYLEFSTLCSEHGNDQLALDSAEMGLENVPGSYRLLVQKGAVLDKLRRLSDAEEALRKAGTLQEDNSVALLSLAVVQTDEGKTHDAERTLAGAIARFPRNYYMHYFRGKLLMKLSSGDTAEELNAQAAEEFKQSIRYNPSHGESYYQLSALYSEAHPKLQEEALLKCLKLDPHHSAAKYALARLYVRTGRKTKGQALLTQFREEQRAVDLQQEKQLRIDVAQK